MSGQEVVPGDLVTAAVAAGILQVSVATLYRYGRLGVLTVWSRGGRRKGLRYSEAEVRGLWQVRCQALPRPVAPPIIGGMRARAARERFNDEILRKHGLR